MRKKATAAAALIALTMFGPASAQVAHSEIVEACMGASNLPEPICTCMADKLGGDEFSDTQRTWYVLSQTDQAAAESVAGDMSVSETMQIAMFSASAPGQCAAGG